MLTCTDAEDLYCFVATENGEIIGSVCFTKMRFESDIRAFILSPMAIGTDHQGKGLGQELINFGINELKKDGVELVITYGDPSFYSKVGFRAVTEAIVPSPLRMTYPEGWQAQSLKGDKIEPITGNAHCVKALNKPELW